MNSIYELLARLSEWAVEPWFTIGRTGMSFYRLVGLVIIVLASWWISAALERLLRRVARRGNAIRFSASGLYALTRGARYTVWILGSVIGLRYLGFDLATLAIVGGAVGIGVGLGLQNIFSNFVSGIVILAERTLKVGDFVDLQSGVIGTVTEIAMRYTRITTNDNVDIIVPNSEFVNGRVINWTLDDRLRRMRIPFGVAYGSDKERVRNAGIAAALSIEGTVTGDRRDPDVWLVRFGDSSLDFELVVWVDHELMTSPGRTTARYLWAIETELARQGIAIPFPQRDLHLRSGSLSVRLDGGASRETGTVKVSDG